MPSVPAANLNSYSTLDEASSYLDDSISGSDWAGVDPDTQSRCLITSTRLLDRQAWEGAATTLRSALTAAVAAAGTGYAVGAILTVSGGTTGAPARAKVKTLSGTAVASIELVDGGLYSVDPATTAATTSSQGGTGCTLTLTLGAHPLQLPHSGMTDLNEAAVSAAVVPTAIVQACRELAAMLARDSTLEAQISTAATSVKRVKAGSAEVELFSPGAFVPVTRFPQTIQELIAPFLLGAGVGVGSSSFGTDAESQFDDCDRSDLTEGLP